MISPSYIHVNTVSQLLSHALYALSSNTHRNTHLRDFSVAWDSSKLFCHRNPLHLPQVWLVNLLQPQPTFNVQKESETAVPREGGAGGQGNLWEEGGEMEWALWFTALRDQRNGFGYRLWVSLTVNRVPDYRIASRCYSPHRYCRISLDFLCKIKRFCWKWGVVVQMQNSERSRYCDEEHLIILNNNSWADRVSMYCEASCIRISINTQKKMWKSL